MAERIKLRIRHLNGAVFFCARGKFPLAIKFTVLEPFFLRVAQCELPAIFAIVPFKTIAAYAPPVRKPPLGKITVVGNARSIITLRHKPRQHNALVPRHRNAVIEYAFRGVFRNGNRIFNGIRTFSECDRNLMPAFIQKEKPLAGYRVLWSLLYSAKSFSPA